MTLSSTFPLGREPLGLSNRELLIRDSEQHVSLRVLALGLPNREILIRDSEQHVSFRALALGLPNREKIGRASCRERV